MLFDALFRSPEFATLDFSGLKKTGEAVRLVVAPKAPALSDGMGAHCRQCLAAC